jgi:hypothetical protein
MSVVADPDLLQTTTTAGTRLAEAERQASCAAQSTTPRSDGCILPVRR